ncbi:hypothetical protein [Lysinibacter cavernae]|uniref:hypothetical protein n=1 Tax=Lysinibacter cavernae TaxID=1640652 RepID=UPI00361DB003
MTFVGKLGLIETEEQERRRLAQAPAGSDSHFWSTLPETVKDWPEGFIVKLPSRHNHKIAVIPVTFRKDTDSDKDLLPKLRNSGNWECIVVASDHLSYPVGGHRLSISATELARGERIEITL